MAKRKKSEDKEKELLEKRLLKIQFYESLTSIVLPEGIPSLARYVFGYCESLKSVTIPQSVTAIARTAFSHCRRFVICAPAGSYAETYAKKNSISFQVLD